MTRTCPAGVALVQRHEGCRLEAYRCPAGIWTIGYGSTRDVEAGMTLNEVEAEQRLRADLADVEAAVDRLVKVPLTENQHAALVSFVFNVGPGALERSTLLRLLNAGDYASVPAQLARWNKAKGQVLQGLIQRRAEEIALWMDND